jgi:hypothetical protein
LVDVAAEEPEAAAESVATAPAVNAVEETSALVGESLFEATAVAVVVPAAALEELSSELSCEAIKDDDAKDVDAVVVDAAANAPDVDAVGAGVDDEEELDALDEPAKPCTKWTTVSVVFCDQYDKWAVMLLPELQQIGS